MKSKMQLVRRHTKIKKINANFKSLIKLLKSEISELYFRKYSIFVPNKCFGNAKKDFTLYGKGENNSDDFIKNIECMPSPLSNIYVVGNLDSDDSLDILRMDINEQIQLIYSDAKQINLK